METAVDSGVPPGQKRPRPAAGTRRRQRNARGQGAQLTEEIVAGAVALLESTGTVESVTLRAVAREVGIAAPSIYARFADRDAIILAVVVRIFDELSAAIKTARDAAGSDPVDRLAAGCRAYLNFGLEHPARYGVLFAERRTDAEDYCKPVDVGVDGMPVLDIGADSFALLAEGIGDCVRAGASASTDVVADAIAVWVTLHGAVTLRTSRPGFPWPAPDQFISQYVLALARITEPGAAAPGSSGSD